MVAVRADFVFNRWDLEILPYCRASVRGASVIMRKAFDCKRSISLPRESQLKRERYPQRQKNVSRE
jgi:hypothetical protein